MGFINAVKSIDPRKVFLVIIAFIPYVDTEIIGVIPILRDLLPVDSIPVLDLSWTERLRLAILIVIPYLDGEILELIGVDIKTLYRD